MTPGLQHLLAFKAAFDLPNEVLSFSVPPVPVDPYTYMLTLGAQRRLWHTGLLRQRRDALRLASTQLGPMLCCTLRGNAGKVKWRVRGGGRPIRGLVRWTVPRVDGADENKAANTKRLLATSNSNMETEKPERNRECVGGP